MPLKELIEAHNQLLLKGDFSTYIKHLYQLGVLLEKDFVLAVESNREGTLAEETDKKKRFYNYITHITASLSNFPTEKDLCLKLWNLQSFLMAWEDPELRKTEDKKLRQAIKFKKDIDKYFRRRIHAALITEVATTYKEINNFLLENKLSEFDLKSKGLREHLADCIRSLKSQVPDNIEQTYDEAAKAITSFTPPAEKFLHGLGIFLGITAALAVAVATGGFLFILLSMAGAPLWVPISISALMFMASFGANFRLFSVHSTKLLCSLAKSGGITEFIDKEGNRAQLSMFRKSILLFGAFVSIAVGLSTASLTIMFGLTLVTALLPTLSLIFPGIIIAILVFGISTALSVVIFKAWVDLMQTRFFLDMRNELTRIFNEIKVLSFIHILGYILQATFIGFALFGLFFLCFTGIPSLVPALGLAGSWVIGLAAFIGDLPFTVITMCAFYASLSAFALSAFNFFFRTEQMILLEEDQRPLSPNKNPLLRIANALMLLVNAIGRSIQIFNGSIISIIAAIACFFSAIAGTLIKQDNHEELIRDKANQASKQSLINYGYATDASAKVETTAPVSVSNSLRSSSSSSSSCNFFPAANGSSSSLQLSKVSSTLLQSGTHCRLIFSSSI